MQHSGIVVARTKLACESVGNHWWNYVGHQKTCFMTKKSMNISTGSKVLTATSDNSTIVTAITFRRNHKIVCLPEKVHETFPKLTAYSASSCAIKILARQHFEGLIHLKVLLLYGNYISIISNDAFADLKSLEVLDLSEFKECFFHILIIFIQRIKQNQIPRHRSFQRPQLGSRLVELKLLRFRRFCWSKEDGNSLQNFEEQMSSL